MVIITKQHVKVHQNGINIEYKSLRTRHFAYHSRCTDILILLLFLDDGTVRRLNTAVLGVELSTSLI